MTAIYTTETLSAMGKEALRQACRDNGISYAKLNNEGMRAALLPQTEVSINGNKETTVVKVGDQIVSVTENEIENDDVEATTKPSTLASMFGLNTKPVPAADSKHITRVVDGKKVDATKPAPVEKKDPPAPRNHAKDYKIQQNRPEQNGVKRPSSGTLCGAVWAYLDKNPETKAGDTVAIAEANGWNRANVLCELYNWRKFNGLTKSAKVQK